ncbi:MAG: RNA 2',3'-cyclic phosphodiesterase [Ardenticatenaceae bacterium]
MSENIRCFVAVQMSDELSEVIWEVQKRLQKHSPMRGLRWVDASDSHITVKFILGGAPVNQLSRIVNVLDRVAEPLDPFTIQLNNLGTFPNIYRPSVIWLGLEEGEKELQRLFQSVEEKLRRIGLKPERRTYHPHLTLARVPKKWTQSQRRAVGNLIGRIKLPNLPPCRIESVALMRSILTPQGPNYMRLSNSLFGEPPPP